MTQNNANTFSSLFKINTYACTYERFKLLKNVMVEMCIEFVHILILKVNLAPAPTQELAKRVADLNILFNFGFICN